MLSGIRRWWAAFALVVAVGGPSRGADEAAVLKRAAELMEEVAATPDCGIPARFLREARGITIVPHMVEAQLGLGRKVGHGVYLPRDEQGRWGPPELVTMATLSVGAEAGREVTDLVILYRTPVAAAKDGNATVILGANLEFRTKWPHRSQKFRGPVEDSPPAKATLTYERKRGLLVGARFAGDVHFRSALESQLRAADAEAKATPANPPAPAAASPGLDRLRAALATAAAPPAAEVAARGAKDPQVAAAGGPVAPAAATPSPR